MCLALPAQVVALDEANETATVALGGVRKAVSIVLVDEVALGDYLLIHVGYALNKISAEEAQRTLALMAGAGLLGDEDAPVEERVGETADEGTGERSAAE